MEGDLIVRDDRCGKFFTIEFNTQKLKRIFNNEPSVYREFDIFKEKLTDEQVCSIVNMVTECIIEVR